MTSAISREDVESELWRLGGRGASLAVITRLLRLIDSYAISTARKYTDIGFIDAPPVDPYSYLLPGQFDRAAKVGRCITCKQPRKLTEFRRDHTSAIGYRTRCEHCKPKTPRKDNIGYLCRLCSERRPLSDFPQQKQDSPSLMIPCIKCQTS